MANPPREVNSKKIPVLQSHKEISLMAKAKRKKRGMTMAVKKAPVMPMLTSAVLKKKAVTSATDFSTASAVKTAAVRAEKIIKN